MDRSMITRAAVILVGLVMAMGILVGCLDEPPPLPPRDNPWDPNNPYPPRAPDSLRARSLSETEVTVTWRDKSGNEDGFRIYEAVEGDTATAVVGETEADVDSIRLSDRRPGVQLSYFILAYNDAGLSYLAGPVFASTRNAPPTAPSSLLAQTASETSILLTWQDRSANEDCFEIEESVGTEMNYIPLTDVPTDCTEYLVSGRRSLVTYFYRIRATNDYGVSLFSESSWATPGSFPPETPTGVWADVLTEQSIKLYWDDRSANEEGFEVFESVGDSLGFALLASLDPNTVERMMSGRLPATDYYYRLRAFNTYGQSSFSAIARASTREVTPTAPNGLEANVDSETGITLTWRDRSANEEGFQIEASVGNPESFGLWYTTCSDTESCSFDNLETFEDYYYRVRAINIYGESQYTGIVLAIPGSFAPAAPDSLDAQAISPTEIALSWLDLSGNEEGFQIQESPNDNQHFQVVSLPEPDVHSVLLSSRTPDVTYYYRIRTINRYGNSPYSNETSTHTPSIPRVPTNLYAEGLTENTIAVQWTDRSDNEDGFELEESIGTDENFQCIDTLAPDADNTVLTDRESLIRYYYRVRAFNDIGYSEYSNTAMAMTSSIMVYVADGQAGITVINATDVENASIETTEDTPGYARTLVVSDGYAYVADWYAGLRVLDLFDPAFPHEVGFYDTPGRAYGVAVEGNHCFVADGDSGLRAIDVTDPLDPDEVGCYITPGAAYAVVTQGDYAFVADGSAGLQILDISKPTQLRRIGSEDTPGLATGIALEGRYCYIADYANGLQVIDVNRVTSPNLVGFVQTNGYACAVVVEGNYAFVADWNNLQIVNISSPGSPGLLGSVNMPGEAWGVSNVNNTAFVATLDGGLRIVDASNPNSPQEINSVATPGLARGVKAVLYR